MTLKEKLENLPVELSSTERQLCAVLLADYPFSGLDPIQSLAQKAHVSAPSVSRFVNKLGYSGFQNFQQSLISELRESERSPVDIHRENESVEDSFFQSHVHQINELHSEMLQAISPAQFDRVVDLIADSKRHIYFIGGRMSDTLAAFFARHLQQARKNVTHLASEPECWPDTILQLRPKDVVFIIDFRRYQQSLERLAKAVRQARAQTIVLTDKWISPAANGATELLSVPIGSKTLWDSYSPALTLIEALLVAIADRQWPKTKSRIEEWDNLRADINQVEKLT